MKEPKLTRDERELLDKIAGGMTGDEPEGRSSRTRSRPRLNDQLPYPVSADRRLSRGANLSELQREFVYQYTSGRYAYQTTLSAIEAKYPSARAHIMGYEELKKAEVQNAIRQIEDARMKRMDINGERILKQLALIATADINEVLEVRIPPCRYCYGKNNLYQRTYAEMEEDLELYNRGFIRLRDGSRRRRRDGDPLFDEAGGAGYDQDMPPNPNCPECRGRGRSQDPLLHYKDSRFLSPAGRALIAGAKITKNGCEIAVHSQLAALSMFARMAARVPQRNVEEMDDNELDAFLAANGVVVEGDFEDLGEDSADRTGDSGEALEDPGSKED